MPFSAEQQLQPLLYIGFKQAARALNTLLRSPVEFSSPKVQILPYHELVNVKLSAGLETQAMVSLNFKSHLSGTAVLGFEAENAKRLVKILTAERGINNEAMHIAAITEVGNIVLSALLGSMANEWQDHLTYTSTPMYVEGALAKFLCIEAKASKAEWGLAYAALQASDLPVQATIGVLFHQ